MAYCKVTWTIRLCPISQLTKFLFICNEYGYYCGIKIKPHMKVRCSKRMNEQLQTV